MTEAVIVDAVRTPGGKRNGQFKDQHPVTMAAHVLKALEERNGLDPAMVDDVIMGCVMQVGEQSLNIGRNAVLAAGWPEEVPSTTVDRQCGSSQQSMHFAAQGVIAGAYDVVVAAGVEVMTRTPMGASIVQGMGFPFPQEQLDRYAETGLPPAGHRRRHDRRRVRHHPRGPRRVRRREPAARRGRPRRRSLRARDRPGRSRDRRRDRHRSPTDEGIRDGTTAESLAQAQARLQRRRQDHRRQLVADLRRRVGRADHERGEGRRARA